jgi:hypothetical protein
LFITQFQEGRRQFLRPFLFVEGVEKMASLIKLLETASLVISSLEVFAIKALAFFLLLRLLYKIAVQH